MALEIPEAPEAPEIQEAPKLSLARRLSLHRPCHFVEGLATLHSEHDSPETKDSSSSSRELLDKDEAEYVMEKTDPASILMNPHYNKGTAFTPKERQILHLDGLLPAAVESIDLQVRRCYEQFSRFTVPMSKYIYLTSLRERNETLFYKLVIDKLEEMMPYIYTPTVGQACEEYGLQYRAAEGIYVSEAQKGKIAEVLAHWKPNVLNEVSIVVVTDGSRILGLGDLGACGMGIPVGKLSLYVAAGGFHPATTLPVVIDAGTDNERLLKDEFYLGTRKPRLCDEEYYALVDEFMCAIKSQWPTALIQFEDFSNNHCFQLLEMYRDKQLCFNDDIQGTGAVIAAGFLNAIKVTKKDAKDCRIVFLGAGAAGIGVANQIGLALHSRYGLTPQECYDLFYMVDSKGLVTSHRGDKLASFKVPYARKDIEQKVTNLVDIVKLVQPVALIGLSGISGAFTEDVINLMSQINERPIIFPLSNPTSKSECSFETVYRLTKGQAVFASGSPFDPIMTEDGKKITVPQGNNLYTFPGLGFGSWLCKATKVTDEMITAATISLADSTSQSHLDQGMLYPPLKEVREVSTKIAAKVMEVAKEQGVAQLEPFPKDLMTFVKENRYEPVYLDWE